MSSRDRPVSWSRPHGYVFVKPGTSERQPTFLSRAAPAISLASGRRGFANSRSPTTTSPVSNLYLFLRDSCWWYGPSDVTCRRWPHTHPGVAHRVGVGAGHLDGPARRAACTHPGHRGLVRESELAVVWRRRATITQIRGAGSCPDEVDFAVGDDTTTTRAVVVSVAGVVYGCNEMKGEQRETLIWGCVASATEKKGRIFGRRDSMRGTSSNEGKLVPLESLGDSVERTGSSKILMSSVESGRTRAGKLLEDVAPKAK
ncbi:hypothetical protein C8R44DRAFT_729486 [Mycena epipterygia]|nr:hypothetical protein C8R44DRAFT_729486 [Mycena epipterygia]